MRLIVCIKDSCDVGTVMNQTVKGQPHAATVDGDKSYNGVLCAFDFHSTSLASTIIVCEN